MGEKLNLIKKILFNVAAVALAVALFSIIVRITLSSGEYIARSEARSIAEKAAVVSANNIGKSINAEINGLQKAMLSVGGMPLTDSEAIGKSLASAKNVHKLNRIMLLDKKGRFIASSEKTGMENLVDVAKEDIGFSAALKGVNYLSDVNTKLTRKAGENCVLLFMPFTYGGALEGVAVDVMPISKIDLLNAPSSTYENAMMWVFRSSGTELLSPFGLTDEEQMWFNQNFTAPELHTLPDELKNKRIGIVDFVVNRNKYYVSFAPVENTNWSVVYYLPEASIISAGVKNAAAVNFLAALLLSIIFIFTVYAVFSKVIRFRKLKKNENIDALTGLHNKEGFEKYFDDMKEKLQGYSIALINTKRFKVINESISYAIGNQTIKDISRIIKSNLKPKEYAFRAAGANFIVIFQDDDKDILDSRMADLISQLEDMQITDGSINYVYKPKFTCSLYQVRKTDINAIDVEDMLVLALSKESGARESKIVYVDNEMLKEMQKKIKLINSIDKAMAEGQIQPYFQAKYDIETQKIVGAETLARWVHPELGELLPNEFIPILEIRGYIAQLDLYMLEEACKMVKKWLGDENIPVPISVNMSAQNISAKGFVEKAEEITQNLMVPPSLIELEFNEDVYNNASPDIIAAINKLHEIGFVLTEDNFGQTGISIEGVCRLPVDVIKISRKIQMEALEDKKLRYALYIILTAIKKMDVDVIFSEIETEKQSELVTALKCNTVQGNIYSKPVSAEEFAGMIFE